MMAKPLAIIICSMVVSLMLCSSVLAANPSTSIWEKIKIKIGLTPQASNPVTAELQSPSTSAVDTNSLSTEVWSKDKAQLAKRGIWCAALKGVFIEFYNAPYYVSQIDVNHDKTVTIADLTMFAKYYGLNTPKAQTWCRNQLLGLNPVVSIN